MPHYLDSTGDYDAIYHAT